MPRISNPDVIEILKDRYFVQHTAMHLSRERLTLPDGTKLPLILPPCVCGDCGSADKMADPGKPETVSRTPSPVAVSNAGKSTANAGPAMSGMGGMSGTMAGAGGPNGMIEAGEPGSGLQLLQMHHEMIRVFRFFLEHHDPPFRFLADWRGGNWQHTSAPDDSGYAPQFWDLDDPDNLPHEIVGMLQVTDPEYLGLVFAGVKRLTGTDAGEVDAAVDELGRFIEQGVKTGPPDGSGFHDTMHEYLAAREGKAAQGAEMNKLTYARFNDYFWSLHLWIDAQYGRLLERRGERFDTSGLDPKKLDMCTATAQEMPA